MLQFDIIGALMSALGGGLSGATGMFPSYYHRVFLIVTTYE